jgi:hypothetical protein
VSSYIFAFLLLSTGEMQAAIRTPGGSEYTANFPNTEAGVHQFVRWAAKEAKFNERSSAQSCLAASVGGDAQLYSTAFFEFAYRATADTVVWSEAHFQQVFSGHEGADRSAFSMLKSCSQEFAKR